MAMFSEVKAIYFDLDDTLCGYWDAAKRALAETWEVVPVPGFTPEQLHEAWVEAFRIFADTLKTSHWYEIYLSQGSVTRTQLMREALLRLDIDDAHLAWRLSDEYGRRRAQYLSLFEGARELLDELKPNYVLGVITNGPADIQREELRDLSIEGLFDHFFIEGEMGEGKPEPRVMARATQAAGCAPHEILMVGNSYRHDIIPAMDAGWRTCWIRRDSDVPPTSRTGKVETRPEDGPVPDATIGHLDELRELLGIHTQLAP